MKLVAAALSIAAILCAPCEVVARPHTHRHARHHALSHRPPRAPESLAPTPRELEWARNVAVAYWHVQQPPCGRETVVTQTPLDTAAGMALFGSCSIAFNSAMDWRDYPVQTCHTYVHEFGHLVLGAIYFAASNPTDPAHSLDAANIMYASPTWWQEEQESRAVGCGA